MTQFSCVSDTDKLNLLQQSLQGKAKAWLGWYLSQHGRHCSFDRLLSDFAGHYHVVNMNGERSRLMEAQIQQSNELFRDYFVDKVKLIKKWNPSTSDKDVCDYLFFWHDSRPVTSYEAY